MGITSIGEDFEEAGHENPIDNIKHSLGGGSSRDTLQAIFDPGNILGFGGESKRSKKARKAQKRIDEQLANITRDQFQHFLDFYRPIEEAALKDAMRTDFTTEGDDAGKTAAAGVRSSAGTLARNLSRSGLNLTSEESEAVRRRRSLNTTRSVAGAENTTRRGLADSRTNLLAEIIGIGRGVSATATGGLQNVADLSAARLSSIQNMEAQAQSTRTATGASIASAIISAY